MMEPWDGPAAMAFTDGRHIGGTLDRNGLRPARYIVTDDDLVVMASESGVLPIPESKIIQKWRLQPGKMFLIDLEAGRIIDDKELKDTYSNAKPYKAWINSVRIKLNEIKLAESQLAHNRAKDVPAQGEKALPSVLDRQQAFGYTQEDLKFLMAPMALLGEEATGSMGNDSPLAVMSNKLKPLYNYFKQLFAQVTNPRSNGHVAGVLHRTEAEPARHQQRQPADAARSVAAGARFRRHGAPAQHQPAHRQQVQVV
jgi:glutamate synthase (NADPH/NADH) large chain